MTPQIQHVGHKFRSSQHVANNIRLPCSNLEIFRVSKPSAACDTCHWCITMFNSCVLAYGQSPTMPASSESSRLVATVLISSPERSVATPTILKRDLLICQPTNPTICTCTGEIKRVSLAREDKPQPTGATRFEPLPAHVAGMLRLMLPKSRSHIVIRARSRKDEKGRIKSRSVPSVFLYFFRLFSYLRTNI